MTAGGGAARRLASEAVTLRAMTETDLPFTFAWRNDDRSRIWFKNPAPLVWTEHVAWFQQRELDLGDRMYIAERPPEGRPVVQLAIYRIDPRRKDAEVGRFLTDPDLAGRGYFADALTRLVRIARYELSLERIYLEVLANNARAISIYRRAGFVEHGREDQLVRMEQHIT